jgi:hypothetical protein
MRTQHVGSEVRTAEEATYSSKRQLNFNGLHGVLPQKVQLKNKTNAFNILLKLMP